MAKKSVMKRFPIPGELNSLIKIAIISGNHDHDKFMADLLDRGLTEYAKSLTFKKIKK